MRRCARCRISFYCSSNCQKVSFAYGHKDACNAHCAPALHSLGHCLAAHGVKFGGTQVRVPRFITLAPIRALVAKPVHTSEDMKEVFRRINDSFCFVPWVTPQSVLAMSVVTKRPTSPNSTVIFTRMGSALEGLPDNRKCELSLIFALGVQIQQCRFKAGGAETSGQCLLLAGRVVRRVDGKDGFGFRVDAMPMELAQIDGKRTKVRHSEPVPHYYGICAHTLIPHPDLPNTFEFDDHVDVDIFEPAAPKDCFESAVRSLDDDVWSIFRGDEDEALACDAREARRIGRREFAALGRRVNEHVGSGWE